MASGTLNQNAVWWEYLILVPGVIAMFVLWVAAIHDTWRSDRKLSAIVIFVVWPAAIVYALLKRKGWGQKRRIQDA